MKLTKKEKDIIIKARKKTEDAKEKFEGFLKEDLYVVNCGNGGCGNRYELGYQFSKTEMLQEIEDFKAVFDLACSAGDRFVCFIDDDGHESWFDEIYGIENMDAAWAKENLTDIREISVKRKKK